MAKGEQNKLSKPSQKLTRAEVRVDLAQSLRSTEDPNALLDAVLKKRQAGEPLESLGQETLQKIGLTFSFDNDLTLAETVPDRYQGLAIELRRQLIKDLDCQTHAEKVLVDAVVSGYMRQLQCARSFNACLTNSHVKNHITSLANNLLSVLSKEMDRANRQMLTAYQTLINLKQPPIKVQIKTKQAFFAQAQQFNTKTDDVKVPKS